jgi:hypothetical protein
LEQGFPSDLFLAKDSSQKLIGESVVFVKAIERLRLIEKTIRL